MQELLKMGGTGYDFMLGNCRFGVEKKNVFDIIVAFLLHIHSKLLKRVES